MQKILLVYILYFLAEDSQAEEIDIDILVESLKRQKDESISMPTYISSVMPFL